MKGLSVHEGLEALQFNLRMRMVETGARVHGKRMETEEREKRRESRAQRFFLNFGGRSGFNSFYDRCACFEFRPAVLVTRQFMWLFRPNPLSGVLKQFRFKPISQIPPPMRALRVKSIHRVLAAIVHER